MDLNAIYSHIFSEFGGLYVQDLNIFFCRCVLQTAWKLLRCCAAASKCICMSALAMRHSTLWLGAFVWRLFRLFTCMFRWMYANTVSLTNDVFRSERAFSWLHLKFTLCRLLLLSTSYLLNSICTVSPIANFKMAKAFRMRKEWQK